uniref:Uncharacterized protein n=1 Tax=Strongyloides stercoralis TaxID=6248 RepID=A0AAF5DJR6_STRER
VMVLNLTNDLLMFNKLSNSSSHSYIRNVANIYKRYLSITDVRSRLKEFLINDIKIIKILKSSKVLELFDKINEKKRKKIINFLDKLMPINVSLKKYSKFFLLKIKAFRKQIFELRIIEKFINNIVKGFYVNKEVKMIYKMLFQYVVYKKGIKNGESFTTFTFYDMKYGKKICFFTIFLCQNWKNLLMIDLNYFCVKKVTRQQTTITEKLEPVTNIFNNINKIKNIFKEAIGVVV